MNTIGSTFRPDIEGLRGIAVLLVVAFHVGIRGFQGGFTGVDVFFALSGYLITGLILRDAKNKTKLDLCEFYARRVRRLLPAAGLMLIVTTLFGLAVFSPLEQQTYSRTARAAALYVSNIWFIRETVKYFAPESASNPLLHTWSLAVEEQFYLFWPLLIALVLRVSRSLLVLAAALALVTSLSFGFSMWSSFRSPTWAFYGVPARAWEFGLGGLAALIGVIRPARNWFSGTIGWAGLTLILVAATVYSPEMTYPGFGAVIPVAGTLGVLLSGATAGPGLFRSVITSRILGVLGTLSYSWYLWHWPVVLFAVARFPSIEWPGKSAAALVALGIAALTHQLVEMPIRMSGFLKLRPLASLTLALVVPALCVGACFLSNRSTHRALASPEHRQYEAASRDRSSLWTAGCVTEFGDMSLHECSFGNRSSVTTVVLFGDSHAAMWSPALELISRNRGWRLVTLIKSACPTARVAVYNPRLRRVEEECSAWREFALRRIRELRPQAVVLANAIGYITGPGRTGGYARISVPEWQTATRSTLQFLNSVGTRTIMLEDVPHATFDVPSCLSRASEHEWPITTCTVAQEPLRSLVLRAERAVAEEFANTTFVDLSDTFCKESACSPSVAGVVVYADSNHITASFAMTVAAELAERIAPAMFPPVDQMLPRS